MTTRISALVYDHPVLTDVDRSTWYVFALSGVLFVAFTVYLTLLYRSFWLTGADFGSYVHIFATTVGGDGFLQHGKYRLSHPSGSYWGAHFSLTLLAFLPLYALFPSPITLLVAKSFVVAASVPALWFVARGEVGDERLAALVTASYALNPFLWAAWLFDFQEQCLLPVLVFAAYHAYVNGARRRFLALLTLVLLTNEFMAFIVAGALAGLALTSYRAGRLRDEAPLFAAGAGLTGASYLLAGLVIDRFSRFGGIPHSSVADPLKPFVEGPRATVGDLFGVVLGNPALLVDLVTYDVFQKFAFFVLLLVPVLFLSANDEVAIGALAPFLGFAWVFAGRPIYYMFGAHYSFYLLPFVYVGAVRVLGRFRPIGAPRALVVRLFVVVLVLNVAGAASVGAEREVVPRTNEHTDTLSEAIERVPADETLLTQNNVYPHVAERPGATYVVRPDIFEQYQRAYGPIRPEYVLVDTRIETGPIDWSWQVREAFDGRLGTEYGVYRYEDGIWIFKRGYDGPTRAITTDERVRPPSLPPPDESRPERDDGGMIEADPPRLGFATVDGAATAGVSARAKPTLAATAAAAVATTATVLPTTATAIGNAPTATATAETAESTAGAVSAATTVTFTASRVYQ
ncbi:DUF2079 domain-containing protein [Halegenticoccus soli]|uniref:DUF2079 domain-containing protein n=1 Tax=Halegenticoccus soli TaxID=1985678 RepID=UPI0018EB92CC|nr:DUF2079 domain-containing protein [Halegenticoccus soli]